MTPSNLPGRRAALSLVGVVALWMSACASSAPPVKVEYRLGHFPAVPTGFFSQSTAGALQAVLDAAIKGGLPGLSATVMTADGQLWTGAAGTADGVHPVEAHSEFAIASITKTVIAAEVMRLSEEGKLHLNDPVSEHLPSSFHFDTNGATIENLLAMESGIPDPVFNLGEVDADPLRDWKPEEVLATVSPDRAKPGDHFVYEDANYMLLSLVIETATGESVATALRSSTLSDPRLSSMVYQPAERPNGPLAFPFLGGHVRANIVEAGGGYLPSKAEASHANGSGCMASDSGALALWGYLLFGGKLLSEQSLLAMSNFGVELPSEDNARYGLGVFDETKIGAGFPAQTIGNGGWHAGGYSSILSVLPTKGIVISVLTNTAGDPDALVVPIAQSLASSVQKQG